LRVVGPVWVWPKSELISESTLAFINLLITSTPIKAYSRLSAPAHLSKTEMTAIRRIGIQVSDGLRDRLLI
jgi:hypothetical protein